MEQETTLVHKPLDHELWYIQQISGTTCSIAFAAINR